MNTTFTSIVKSAVFAALLAVPVIVEADDEAWVEYSDSTLTFYYNDRKADSAATTYSMQTKVNDEPGWQEQAENVTKVVFDSSFAQARPTTCYNWFCGMAKLAEIVDLKYLNTSEVISMVGMFEECGMTSLDLRSFDTGNVQAMTGMFYNCKNLTTLDLSGLSASKVVDMESMFEGCVKLQSLDLSSFYTDSLNCTYSMFDSCMALESLDISHFNTSKLKDLGCMFSYCSSLTSLDVSSFDTSKVIRMMSTFLGCSSLKSLDLTSFTSEELHQIDNMFYNCTSLEHIYVNGNFKTDNCYKHDVFGGCESLPGFDSGSTGVEKANYNGGYFTRRYNVTVGDDTYHADGVPAVLDEYVIFDTEDEFSADGDFCFSSERRASYSRPVASHWTTLCLPFDFDTEENTEYGTFYEIASVDETKITVKQIEGTVKGGTPVLFYTDKEDFRVYSTYGANVVAKPLDTTCLKSTFQKKAVKDDAANYVFSRDKFWNVASLLEKTDAKSVMMAPYRAYVVVSGSESKAASLDITAEETTDISSLDAQDGMDLLDGGELYDLQGRRLSAPAKGLLVVKKGDRSQKILFQ